MKISVILEALTGSFETDLNRAAKATDKRMKEIQKSAQQAGKVLGAALAAGAVAGAAALKAAIDNADELDEMAQRTGIAVEALSRLQVVAKLGAVEMETLQKATGRLAVQQQAYADGNKQAIAMFDALGVKATEAGGKLRDADDVLQDLAGVFSRLPDGANKTAIALDLFGKAGQELIPFLNKGGEEIERLNRLADQLGVTISGTTAASAGEFNDTLDLLGFGVKGLATQVAADLLPDLNQLTKAFLENVQAGGGVSETAHNIATAIRFVGNASLAAVDGVQALTAQFIGLYNTLELISKLNPGLAIAKAIAGTSGDSDAAQARTAFEMMREETGQMVGRFGGGASKGTTGGRKRGAGGKFTGFNSGAEDAALADYLKGRRAAQAAMQANTGATKANTEAARAAAEAKREQAERERDLAQAVAESERATKEFVTTLEDLVAQQAGPLAESNLAYARRQKELEDLQKKGEISTLDLAKATGLLEQQRLADAEAIRRQLDTGGEQLKQLEDELRILNLKTQAERDRAMFMKDNPTATGAQAAAAARVMAQIDETKKAIAIADDFRAGFEDAFVSIIDGSKSAEEALKQFADTFIQQMLRMAAQKLSASLFGDMGTPAGGGSGGGFLSALLGLFGGGSSAPSGTGIMSGFNLSGYANGTDFAPGGAAWVGERGPEIVNLPRGAQVIPSHRAAASGARITQNFYGDVTKQNAQYAANQMAKKLAFSGRG